MFVTCSTNLRDFILQVMNMLEKSPYALLSMRLMCTCLFTYCVDVELPSGFVNHDATREKEWTNKLVRNIIILVSCPDVNFMVNS